MAKFKIDAVNYCYAGTRGKLLNLDFSKVDEDDQVLESTKNASFFVDYRNASEGFSYDYVDPPPPGSDVDVINAYNAEVKANRIKVKYNSAGFKERTDVKIIHPLYDAKDMKWQSEIGHVTLWNEDGEDETEKDVSSIEIFVPYARTNPIGFANLNARNTSTIFCLTDKTTVAPVFKQTDIRLQRKNLGEENVTTSMPTYAYYYNPYDSERLKYRIHGDASGIEEIENFIQTFTYTPLSSLRLNGEENLPANEATPVSSYYQYLQSFDELSGDMLSTLFKTKFNFQNIDRNYVVETTIGKANSSYGSSSMDYNGGTIPGDMILTKNTYDACYGVKSLEVGKFQDVREYLGIGTCGGKVFLKFFDDKVYNHQIKMKSTEPPKNDSVSAVSLVSADVDAKYTPEERAYEKVECIYSINRFISTTKHKANLFSINVNNLENALNAVPEYRESTTLKTKIKQDIDNSIRELVKSFSPAHTQYFKTFFENDKPDNGC